MDLSSNLIESKKSKQKGGWKASLAAVGVHGAIIGFVVFMTASASHKITAEEKPIRAFVVSSAAAPPPPPPPPPPAPASASTPTPPHVVKPVQVQVPKFVQPTEVPKEVPKVEAPTTTQPVVDTTPAKSDEPAGEAGGVAGGVSGGVAGGVQGGVVGGQVGGQVGGVLGGTPGGVVGGTVGGTGNGSGSGEAAPPPPPPPAPEPVPDTPVRVGGDVKAPVIIRKVEPIYTETARKGRIAGVVILEAIINKDGSLEDVRVLKGLPMGLSDRAVEAVKEWKFRPGTMNGQPVAVIFNLTINFTLN